MGLAHFAHGPRTLCTWALHASHVGPAHFAHEPPTLRAWAPHTPRMDAVSLMHGLHLKYLPLALTMVFTHLIPIVHLFLQFLYDFPYHTLQILSL